MAIRIGITGGIGSGKTTVCNIFKLLGTPVFEADKVARELMNTSPELKEKLIHLYGEAIYSSTGLLDRKKLAAIIFDSEIERKKVNGLVHPAVRNAFENWARKIQLPYVINEAAILFESGFYRMMDFNILVTAPESMRIKRVVKRDKTPENEVKRRMKAQWTDDKKRKLATLELVNNNQELIIPKIIQIDKNLKENGKIW